MGRRRYGSKAKKKAREIFVYEGERRQAPCPYFGECGGCSIQDIPYSVQLELKKERLMGYFAQVYPPGPEGQPGFPEPRVHHGDEWHYRNRMDFVFHGRGLGFRRPGVFHSRVDVQQCLISNPELNRLLQETRDWWLDRAARQGQDQLDAFDQIAGTGALKYAVIRTPGLSDSLGIVVNTDAPTWQAAEDAAREEARDTSARNMVITRTIAERDMSIGENYEVIKGSDVLSEEVLGRRFEYSLQGFFQNNHQVTEILQTRVRERLVELDTRGLLLDLYGGVGTFGIINADLFDRVLVVENYQGSIDSAHRNIATNGVENVEAHCRDARELTGLGLEPGERSQALTVICDPPRSGMHPKAVKALMALEPARIFYISCNPKQLPTDLGFFQGYRPVETALFDMFPQTIHMEALVELVRDEAQGLNGLDQAQAQATP